MVGLVHGGGPLFIWKGVDSIEYSDRCNVAGNLARGTGTIHMIKTMMTIVQKLFGKDRMNIFQPRITSFSFDDASSRECISSTGTTISLSCLSIALYGKTWYEKNFGATLMDSSLYSQYTEDIQKLTDESFKPDYENFKLIYHIDDRYDEIIRNTYETSNTYRSFFTKLSQTMTKKDLCVFLSTWLETFITRHVFKNNYLKLRWIIDIHSIRHVNLINGKYMEHLTEPPDYDGTMRGGGKFLDDSKTIHIVE